MICSGRTPVSFKCCMMDDNGLLCNVYNTTELGEEDVTKLFVMDQDMFPGWLEEHQNALETMSDF